MQTMAEELLIDPTVVRAKTELELRSIPVNAYQLILITNGSCSDEVLDRIGRDMLLLPK
jgi:hypothetical protein